MATSVKHMNQIIDPHIMEHPQLHGKVATFGKNPYWSTLGDLHGNAMYFLYFAVHRGAMSCTPEQYHQMAKIYENWSRLNTDDERKEQAQAYFGYIKELKVARGARIRLIGDELHDRGLCDIFSLAKFAHFKKNGGIYETILSNHAAGFILCIEDAIYHTTKDGVLNINTFKSRFIEYQTSLQKHRPKFAISLSNLQYALEKDIVSVKDLLDLYASHKETFKAFSYDYDTTKKVVIYSHAPVSRAMILAVACEMPDYLTEQNEKNSLQEKIEKFNNNSLTDEDLIPIIDMINRIVQLHAHHNKLSNLLYDQNGKQTALFNAMENRDDPKCNINNVHGHDPRQHGKGKTLDGGTGRFDIEPHLKEYKEDNPEYLTLRYTSSVPWENPFDPVAIPEEEMLTGEEYNAYRWKRNSYNHSASQTHKNLRRNSPVKQHTGDNENQRWRNQTLTLFGYRENEEMPFVILLFNPAFFDLIFPFVNSVISFFTFGWVESAWARTLFFPLRIVAEGIKLPLTIASSALGLIVGISTAITAPAYHGWWRPIVGGVATGLQPFAPNASQWLSDWLTVKDPNAQRRPLSEAYLGGFVLSAAALGVWMTIGHPFQFLGYLPLDSHWIYLAGTMFMGAASECMSGIIKVGEKALNYFFETSSKTVAPLVPTARADAAPTPVAPSVAESTPAPSPGTGGTTAPITLSKPSKNVIPIQNAFLGIKVSS